MIDFTKLTGIEHGGKVVTQIEDSTGRVLWALQSGAKAVLRVEKITATTYAGETSYADEQFLALDIYPKTNGTVKITYGGLTKIIKDTSGVEEPNAQMVYFGTFNGVSDGVATPDSGELTIEGQFYAFGCGTYASGYKATGQTYSYCACITNVTEWGEITAIPLNAFYDCDALTSVVIPEGVTDIGNYAFYECNALTSVVIPNAVKRIGNFAFHSCTGFTSVVVPEGVTHIGDRAFQYCDNAASFTFPSSLQEIGAGATFKNLNSGVPYTVKMLATVPPTYTGGDSSIVQQNGTSKCTNIVVPKGCGDAYKTAAGWSKHEKFIVEAS